MQQNCRRRSPLGGLTTIMEVVMPTSWAGLAALLLLLPEALSQGISESSTTTLDSAGEEEEEEIGAADSSDSGESSKSSISPALIAAGVVVGLVVSCGLLCVACNRRDAARDNARSKQLTQKRHAVQPASPPSATGRGLSKGDGSDSDGSERDEEKGYRKRGNDRSANASRTSTKNKSSTALDRQLRSSSPTDRSQDTGPSETRPWEQEPSGDSRSDAAVMAKTKGGGDKGKEEQKQPQSSSRIKTSKNIVTDKNNDKDRRKSEGRSSGGSGRADSDVGGAGMRGRSERESTESSSSLKSSGDPSVVAVVEAAEILAQKSSIPGLREAAAALGGLVGVADHKSDPADREDRVKWCISVVMTLERAEKVMRKAQGVDPQAERILVENVQDCVRDMAQIMELFRSKNMASKVFASTLCKRRQAEAELAVSWAVHRLQLTKVYLAGGRPGKLSKEGIRLERRVADEALAASKQRKKRRRLDQLELEIPEREMKLTDEVIGKGGFGTVYLADLVGHNAAAKVVMFDAELSEDEEQDDRNGNARGATTDEEEAKVPQSDSTKKTTAERRQRRAFTREVEAMKRLRGPHTVQIYGAITSSKDRLVLVMELMAGGDLRHRLRKATRPLEEGTLRGIVRDVCSGMAFLHDKQTVHGDLKSANVLFDGDGKAKIADFGSSLWTHHTTRTATSSVNPGQTVGMSLPWAAPEVLNRKSATFETDVYSFGVVVWECLSRKVPWGDVTSVDMLVLSVNQGERPALPSEAPADLQALTKSCWAQDPTVRPTFKRILVDLQTTTSSSTSLAQESESEGEVAATDRGATTGDSSSSGREEGKKGKDGGGGGSRDEGKKGKDGSGSSSRDEGKKGKDGSGSSSRDEGKKEEERGREKKRALYAGLFDDEPADDAAKTSSTSKKASVSSSTRELTGSTVDLTETSKESAVDVAPSSTTSARNSDSKDRTGSKQRVENVTPDAAVSGGGTEEAIPQGRISSNRRSKTSTPAEVSGDSVKDAREDVKKVSKDAVKEEKRKEDRSRDKPRAIYASLFDDDPVDDPPSTRSSSKGRSGSKQRSETSARDTAGSRDVIDGAMSQGRISSSKRRIKTATPSEVSPEVNRDARDDVEDNSRETVKDVLPHGRISSGRRRIKTFNPDAEVSEKIEDTNKDVVKDVLPHGRISSGRRRIKTFNPDAEASEDVVKDVNKGVEVSTDDVRNNPIYNQGRIKSKRRIKMFDPNAV